MMMLLRWIVIILVVCSVSNAVVTICSLISINNTLHEIEYMMEDYGSN